jgi:mRNA interferase MazF
MTRGDVVVVATRGAYTSKPRPAVVVQADDFNSTHASITVCPVTSDCVDAPLFRVPMPSAQRTGLTAPSQVMVDKVVSVPREAIGQTVGRCGAVELEAITDALRRWLAI